MSQANGDERIQESTGVLEDYVDAETIAKMLGLSISTVYRWARQGRLKGRKQDGRWSFERSSLPVEPREGQGAGSSRVQNPSDTTSASTHIKGDVWHRNALLKLHIKEGEAMHNQILERSRIQQRLLSVGSALAVGVFSFLGSTLIRSDAFGRYDAPFLLFLLLVPFPFYGLVIYYGHIDFMIRATAGYIHTELRYRISSIIGSDEFWRNEYHFEQARRAAGRSVSAWIGSFGVLIFVPIVVDITAIAYLWKHLEVLEYPMLGACPSNS